jgi:hypothetical protein
MFDSVKPVRGNKCAQVFTDGYGYDRIYPMEKKKFTPEALMEFIRDAGVPNELLVTDNAGEETGKRRNTVVQELRIKQRTAQLYHIQWQNRTDACVREVKKGVRRATITRVRSPKWLWDYCGEWVSAI